MILKRFFCIRPMLHPFYFSMCSLLMLFLISTSAWCTIEAQQSDSFEENLTLSENDSNNEEESIIDADNAQQENKIAPEEIEKIWNELEQKVPSLFNGKLEEETNTILQKIEAQLTPDFFDTIINHEDYRKRDQIADNNKPLFSKNPLNSFFDELKLDLTKGVVKRFGLVALNMAADRMLYNKILGQWIPFLTNQCIQQKDVLITYMYTANNFFFNYKAHNSIINEVSQLLFTQSPKNIAWQLAQKLRVPLVQNMIIGQVIDEFRDYHMLNHAAHTEEAVSGFAASLMNKKQYPANNTYSLYNHMMNKSLFNFAISSLCKEIENQTGMLDNDEHKNFLTPAWITTTLYSRINRIITSCIVFYLSIKNFYQAIATGAFLENGNQLLFLLELDDPEVQKKELQLFFTTIYQQHFSFWRMQKGSSFTSTSTLIKALLSMKKLGSYLYNMYKAHRNISNSNNKA